MLKVPDADARGEAAAIALTDEPRPSRRDHPGASPDRRPWTSLPSPPSPHGSLPCRRRSLREGVVVMRILVTSASGANGNGYGAILGFGPEGEFTGPFSSDPRITDPRGLALHPSGALVYLNSGDDRMLALDLDGNVVRDSGPIPGLDPGGAEFGPDGRYCVTMRRRRTILAVPAASTGRGTTPAGGHRPVPARVRLRARRRALPVLRRRAVRARRQHHRRVRPLRNAAHASPGHRPRTESP